MNGFLLINKPKGITSFDVIRRVRKTLNMRKVGHAGTLDPLATGLLILALGEGTKLLEYLIKQNKTYEAEITFGSVSDTFDAEGEILKISDKIITREEIQDELRNFQGKIQQIPPKYSALKINGKKACDLARKGEDVKMKAREIEIYETEILDYTFPKLNLKINCSTGTYIRSIAHDLGEDLKCGGYLTALKRAKIGEYFIDDAIDLEEVSAGRILSLEWGSGNLRQINLEEKDAKRIKNGLQVFCDEDFDHEEQIECFCNNKIISICKYLKPQKRLQPVKNINQ